MDPLVKEVQSIIEQAPSLAAAADELVKAFTTLGDQVFVEQLARALLQAALTGQGGLALSSRQARAQAAVD